MEENFRIADKICSRAKRGLPYDRWIIGDKEMTAFIKAYSDMCSIAQNLHNDMIKRGLDAMSTDEKKGP